MHGFRKTSVDEIAHRAHVAKGTIYLYFDSRQALIAGLFAFGGWHMVTYAAGETVDPTRTIPRALLGGTVVVTICYIALNAVYMYVLPMDVVIASSRVAPWASTLAINES